MRLELPGRATRVLQTALCLALCLAPVRAEQGAEAPAVRSSVDLEIYGYLKLDAAYDTARTFTGDFVKWVELAPGNDGDDAFNMTANQSRFGLRIGGPGEKAAGAEPRVETSGVVEFDAYGGGAANRSNFMLRHAYLRVLWLRSGTELLAGQTSDLISPLNPQTLNYSVAWWSGNIGYRRPQLRVTRRTELDGERTLELAAALARTIGSTQSEFTSNDAGADSGLPSLQARAGVRLGTGSAYGLSGHWGEEEYDRTAGGEAATFDSWSANLDVRQRLGPKRLLQVEAFTGVNLAAYLGGIGQGVDADRQQEIAARGGWVSLDLGPYGDWSYHLGASVEDVRDEDIESGNRSRNRSLFASGVRSLTEHFEIGGEISHWATQYKDTDEVTALRGQLSLIYRF